MSVWRRFNGHGFPSLVTTNVDRRVPIFRDRAAAQSLREVIEEVAREEPVTIHAWVIMPDHMHLIVSVEPSIVLGRPIQLIKGRFAWRYNRAHSRIGKFWQDRYHEKALRSEEEFYAGIEYVEYNPVAGGIVDSPADYKWSSAARRQVRLRA